MRSLQYLNGKPMLDQIKHIFDILDLLVVRLLLLALLVIHAYTVLKGHPK
jgi:hypothetical protein